MSCIDIQSEFLSYCKTGAQHSVSNWSQSLLLKSSNIALCEIKQLNEKLNYLQEQEKYSMSKIHIKKEQLSQKLKSVHNSIKACQNQIKKIDSLPIDIKTNSIKFGEDFKTSVVAGLQIKMMALGVRFKKLYKNFLQPKKHKAQSNSNQGIDLGNNARDLGRSHFLQQTQEQIMEQAAVNQYRQIQKSLNQISGMYKQTMSAVRMHELIIDSISGNIDDTEFNVDEGRKHLSQAHYREQKNRKFIIKFFAVLYFTVTVYIVFLS